jgi:nucleolar MIF4G domain-containing protein 1
VSRKEVRKQARDDKKHKKFQSRDRTFQEKGGRKTPFTSKVDGKPESKVNGDSDEFGEFQGFDDSAGSGEDGSGENMSTGDTWAALRAIKEKKSAPKTDPQSADDTWAALRAMKQKKTSKKLEHAEPVTADDTWIALKAMKEKRLNGGLESGKGTSRKRKPEESKQQPSKKANKEMRMISSKDATLLAQDELEMEYYKKKLGLKSLKLPKSEMEDELDDILGGLDFDRFAEGSVTEEDTASGHGSETESTNANEDDHSEEDSVDDEAEEEVPKLKENPYVAPVAAASTEGGRYLPPSRRKLMAEMGESEELARLRRTVKGQLNRLTEANIGTIINELENLYLRHPRSHLNSIITSIIIDSTALQGTLQESFLIVHAALATALYKTLGVEFGAYFVQTMVETFQKHYSDQTSGGKEASNLLSLLSEIYTFQLISCKLVYDFVRMFLNNIDEIKTEFLLKIVRNSGPQLRSDDPASLKDIIFLLQSSVAKADSSTLNSRTKFLIESIIALKNNRHKSATESAISSTQRMKKFLGTIHGQTGEPLHVSLDDINNIETKGKWWLVGAAYSNNETVPAKDVDLDAIPDMLDAAEPNWMELAKKQRMNTDVRKAVFVALMSSEDYVDAYERLQKLKLKSKQEREIPKVILHCCSNEEIYNPFYGLVAAKLCGQHSLRKTFQFSLWDFIALLQGDDDEASEDDLKTRHSSGAEDDKDQLRRTSHLARLYASIVAQGEMTLDVLKVVDFLTACAEVKIFLEFFFVTLFELMGKKAERSFNDGTKKSGFGDSMFAAKRDEKELAQLLLKTKDRSLLRGVQYFQQYVVKSTILPAKPKQRERVIWGSKITADFIEGLASSMRADSD